LRTSWSFIFEFICFLDVIIVSEEKSGNLFEPLCGKEEDKYLQ